MVSTVDMCVLCVEFCLARPALQALFVFHSYMTPSAVPSGLRSEPFPEEVSTDACATMLLSKSSYVVEVLELAWDWGGVLEEGRSCDDAPTAWPLISRFG